VDGYSDGPRPVPPLIIGTMKNNKRGNRRAVAMKVARRRWEEFTRWVIFSEEKREHYETIGWNVPKVSHVPVGYYRKHNGTCGNKGCSCCGCERWIQREDNRRARKEGQEEVRQGIEEYHNN
jgi:hypothetical protein